MIPPCKISKSPLSPVQQAGSPSGDTQVESPALLPPSIHTRSPGHLHVGLATQVSSAHTFVYSSPGFPAAQVALPTRDSTFSCLTFRFSCGPGKLRGFLWSSFPEGCCGFHWGGGGVSHGFHCFSIRGWGWDAGGGNRGGGHISPKVLSVSCPTLPRISQSDLRKVLKKLIYGCTQYPGTRQLLSRTYM